MKKTLKLYLLVCVMVCSLFCAVACKEKTGGNNVTTTSLTLTETSITLMVGEKREVRVSNVDNKNSLSWSSENESIAMVFDGKIYGRAEGNTVITVNLGNQSAKCEVSVLKNESVESYPSILVNKENLGLQKGQRFLRL